MRTTVTLDSDTEQLLRQRMAREGISFKRALNESIRESADRGRRVRLDYSTPTASLGAPLVNLDRALQFAGELEDEELARRLEVGQ